MGVLQHPEHPPGYAPVDLPLYNTIQGKPEQAPNIGETYSKFAVPIYVCIIELVDY